LHKCVAKIGAIDEVEKYGLSVAAFKCDRVHNVGRNRSKQDRVSVAGGTAALAPLDRTARPTKVYEGQRRAITLG
jgi:hypothetical protein